LFHCSMYLTPSDIAEYGGYYVTRPDSTVRDMLASVSENPEIIECVCSIVLVGHH